MLLNFEVATNATWRSDVIVLRDQDDALIQLPMGTTIRMHLRLTAESVDVPLELSLENGMIEIVDRDASSIRISVPTIRLGSLTPATYAYDVIVTLPTGRAHRPYAGSVTVSRGITR